MRHRLRSLSTLLLASAALLLSAGLSLPGCSRPTSANLEGWNCLLITIDTVRQDRLGIYGRELARTARMDEIGARGVVFDQAVAAAPTTLPSHASILTGTHPPFHGVRGNAFYSLPEERTSMAEILRDGGYQTAAVIGSTVLDSRFGIAQGFDHYDDDDSEMTRETEVDPSRPADRVTLSAMRIADTFRDDAPWFLWVHYYDAHLPRTQRPKFTPPTADPLDPDVAYDVEIAYIDYFIGMLLDRLQETGRMEKTIVMIVGDHGEGIGGPHIERTHGMFVYHDTQRIPFIVYAGDAIAGGRRSDRLVQQIDVAPTVLDLLGFEIGDEMQGATFRDALEGRASDASDIVSYSETMLPWESYGWSPLFQVRDARWKYIRGPYDELYDLANDPDELTNVAPQHPDIIEKLGRRLDDVLRERPGESAIGLGLVQDPAELKRLEALGYAIGGRAEEELPPLDTLRHPVEMYPVIDKLDEVSTLAASGEESAATRILRDLRREDPANYDVLRRLADLEARQAQWNNALDAARRLVVIRPDLPHSYFTLADTLAARSRHSAALGREDEARQAMDEAIDTLRAIPEGSTGLLGAVPLTRLGQLLAESGREDEALRAFDRALEIDPMQYSANRAAGEIRRDRGDEAAAIRHFEAAASAVQDDDERLGPLLGRLLTLYQSTGDRKNVEATAKVLIQRFPDEPAAKLAERVLRSNGGG